MYKRLIVSSALVLALGSAAGCNSQWWQDFKNDPVAQVQAFETTAAIVLDGARTAWAFVQPYLGDKGQAANQVFQNAMATVDHALGILNAAVQAAVDAKQPKPDFTKLIQDVNTAIQGVLAIVDQWKGSAPAVVLPGDAGLTGAGKAEPPGLEDAKSGLKLMQRYTTP